MILQPNKSQTLILPAGQVLTLANPSGTTGSVVRMAASPGGGDAQSVTAIAGAALSFGPYAQPERFNIICTSGTVTYTIAIPDPSDLASILANLADVLQYKGVIDCSANPNYPAASAGHVYKVSVDGKIGGASGAAVSAGDTLICAVDDTAAGTQAAVGANWGIVQANLIDADVADAITKKHASGSDDQDLTNLAPTTLAINEKTPVNAVAATGTLTVTGASPQIANNDTVTIDTKVYTYKTALTSTEGEVLLGASDTAALLNLKSAINHAGTPDTDYKCAAEHPTVTGTSSDATTLVVTAKTKGVSTIATTETGASIAWGAATLAGGVDGTVGVANETCADASYVYHSTGVNTIAGANWRRVTLGAVY